MSANQVRVFAALELPAPVQAQLGELVKALQPAMPHGSVRWVRPEGIHLTLQFYGEVERSRVAGIEAALSEAAGAVPALTLALSGLGAFPDAARARVLWVGLAGDVPALRRLQRAVEAGGLRLGFKPEARGFHPHLTLGRVNQPLRPPEQRRLVDGLAATGVPASAPFTVEALSLMRSELSPGGAVYARLFGVPLTGPAAASTQP